MVLKKHNSEMLLSKNESCFFVWKLATQTTQLVWETLWTAIEHTDVFTLVIGGNFFEQLIPHGSSEVSLLVETGYAVLLLVKCCHDLLNVQGRPSPDKTITMKSLPLPLSINPLTNTVLTPSEKRSKIATYWTPSIFHKKSSKSIKHL